jgi:ribose transport system permease protein
MLFGIGILRPNFLTPSSIANLTQQVPLYGVMALGMVFLLSMREIDLSVGAIFGVCIVSAAVLMQKGLDPWLAAGVGVGVGVLLGFVNGILANGLRIPTIIVTLGTLSMFRGVALILTDGRSIGNLPRENSFFTILGGSALGLPVAFWVFVVLTVVLTVVYRSSRFGLVVRAIGSNPRAAELSGIRLGRTRLAALMLMGSLCGIAGMLTLAFFQSGDSSLGTGYELLVIASAVIGGTGLSGGRGTVPGAFLGALVLGVISSGLLQFGITANWTTFATGAVIIGAVALDYFVRRRSGSST